MQHSVKFIALSHSEISSERGDKKLFVYEDFLNFAKDNQKKYSLIKTGDDFFVSTWYSGDLVEAYRKTL